MFNTFYSFYYDEEHGHALILYKKETLDGLQKGGKSVALPSKNCDKM